MNRFGTQMGGGLLFGALIALVGCASEPSIQRGEDAEVVMDRLSRVDNSRVDMAYVDPDYDYSKFDSVLINPLNLDKVKIKQPSTSGSLSRVPRDWELTDTDRKTLTEAFAEVMSEQLAEESGLKVVDEPGPGVIVVDTMLTEIAPSAPKDDGSSMRSARSRVYTEGAGSMSIVIALGDSENGEVLALIKDTHDMESEFWGVNNRATNLGDVRRTIRYWGSRISGGLVALQSMSANAGE